MDDAALGLRDEIGGVAQEQMRGRAAPFRVARREMHADIAGAERAEHRVGQRMQPDIGIGMADKPVAVRDFEAAQPDMIARPESMYVEALAAAEIAGTAARQLFGAREIVCRRHFEIALRAFDEAHGQAGALGDGGVIGQLHPGDGAMRRQDGTIVEALRRLHAPQRRCDRASR